MRRIIKREAWTWEATGAIFSFAGGILAAFFGSLLTASTWILGTELHPLLRSFGTALLVSTIPLLIFAGCCLDWMERDRNKPQTGKSGNGNRESRLN